MVSATLERVRVNIVLLGANGGTGREVIVQALRAGDTVTALVRAEGKLTDLSHERLDVHVGSPCDPRVLEELLQFGQDVVISTLGPRKTDEGFRRHLLRVRTLDCRRHAGK